MDDGLAKRRLLTQSSAADVVVVDTVRISAPPRMFREIASLLPLVEAVVVGDWLCRHGHATPEGLAAASAGCPRARHAASHVRERVDSPMETRLRMLLVPQWERDVDRLGDVDELGWRTIRVTSRGVYRTPEATLQRVWRALVERGVRCSPPSDAWRPHFGH